MNILAGNQLKNRKIFMERKSWARVTVPHCYPQSLQIVVSCRPAVRSFAWCLDNQGMKGAGEVFFLAIGRVLNVNVRRAATSHRTAAAIPLVWPTTADKHLICCASMFQSVLTESD